MRLVVCFAAFAAAGHRGKNLMSGFTNIRETAGAQPSEVTAISTGKQMLAEAEIRGPEAGLGTRRTRIRAGGILAG